MIQACKDNPTRIVRDAPKSNKKQPPKQEQLTRRLSLKTVPVSGEQRMSRAFSSMQFDSTTLNEYMKPWYTWALDIMACGV
jgi:hypothetical protein